MHDEGPVPARGPGPFRSGVGSSAGEPVPRLTGRGTRETGASLIARQHEGPAPLGDRASWERRRAA